MYIEVIHQLEINQLGFEAPNRSDISIRVFDLNDIRKAFKAYSIENNKSLFMVTLSRGLYRPSLPIEFINKWTDEDAYRILNIPYLTDDYIELTECANGMVFGDPFIPEALGLTINDFNYLDKSIGYQVGDYLQYKGVCYKVAYIDS